MTGAGRGRGSLGCEVRTLLPHDAPLPWRAGTAWADQSGVVIDAHGDTVLVVDVERERSDEDACNIAQAIVLAVNAAAGFDTAGNAG